MRSILQLFSLMYMALRRPLAVLYESQALADAIAGAALFMAVCFNVVGALFVFKPSIVSTVFDDTPKSVLLAVCIVAMLVFNHAMFGQNRAERFAAEGKRKWPALAENGSLIAASYVIGSALLMFMSSLLTRGSS